MLFADQGRLTELKRLKAMERIAEERFSPITRLASMICQTPIAFISVLDQGQEHFLSRIGFDILKLPLDMSICGDVIEQNQVYVVPDIAQDSRFCHLPSAIGKPYLRFYAGAPLVTSDGTKLGVLCVLDDRPRSLTRDQELCLETLAQSAVNRLEDELMKDELKLAVTRLKTLINSLNKAIILENEFRLVAAINDKCAAFFDIRIEDVVGGNLFDLFCGVAPIFKDPETFMRIILEHSAKGHAFPREELQTKDGRHLEFSCEPIRVDDEAKGFLWIFKDVTEAKEAERLIEVHKAQLAMSSKMAALGEVAAGIAHEINNPLTIIQSIGYILKNASQESTHRERIVREAGERIEQTTRRISRIIKGLLQFAREAEPEQKSDVRIIDIIEETLSFVQERFQHHGIALQVSDFDPGFEIRCSPTALSQILINLLSNAFDAAASSLEKRVWINVQDREMFLRMEVWDSGKGVPATIREKIMQPFFTTKEIGKGSGLGLSISSGLAERMGGRLYLATDAPATCFVLELPKQNAPRLESGSPQ